MGTEARRQLGPKKPNEVVSYKNLPAVIDAVKEGVASRLKLFSSVGLVAAAK